MAVHSPGPDERHSMTAQPRQVSANTSRTTAKRSTCWRSMAAWTQAEITARPAATRRRAPCPADAVMTLRSVAVRRRAARCVECGIAVEEADRLELEAGVVDGHDRPVLRAGEVGEAEGVPQDHVLPVQRAVTGDERLQAPGAGALVDDLAGGPLLSGVVLRDPQVTSGEGAALGDHAGRVGQQGRLSLRVEGVGHVLAQAVLLVG